MVLDASRSVPTNRDFFLLEHLLEHILAVKDIPAAGNHLLGLAVRIREHQNSPGRLDALHDHLHHRLQKLGQIVLADEQFAELLEDKVIGIDGLAVVQLEVADHVIQGINGLGQLTFKDQGAQPDGDAVAVGQLSLGYLLIVDPDAINAAQVLDKVGLVFDKNPGVAARNRVVAEVDVIEYSRNGVIPADEDLFFEEV